jgi:hypothetical protein
LSRSSKQAKLTGASASSAVSWAAASWTLSYPRSANVSA